MDAFRSISPSTLNRLLLAVAASLALTACGSEDSNGDERGNSDSVTNPVANDTDSDFDNSSSDLKVPSISANTCNASSGARCFYAAPLGTGDGSANNPGSLTALLPQLHAGDTLYLTEGVYQQYLSNDADAFILSLNKYFRFASEPSVEKPIRIQGYPGHNAIIRGDSERRCILVDGQSHLEFRDLTVENCFNEGMRIGWDVPEENITLDGMTFRQIRYHDNSGFVYIQNYKNVIIENSTFHDYLPKSNGQTGYYLKMFQAIDTTVRHNHFYGEGGGMYYKHGESQTGRGGYTRIYNNHFDQLSKQGVYTNQNRSEIYDNLFTNNGGIAVHQEDGTRPPFTQDVHIHHNTLVNSAIVLNHGSNDGSYFDAFGLGAKYAQVHNNLIKNSAYHIWVYGSNQQYDEGIHLTSYDNCFDNSNGDFLIDYFSSNTFGDKGAKMSLSQWQAAGYDNQSLEQTLILDNDYRLPAGSPCAATGRRQ